MSRKRILICALIILIILIGFGRIIMFNGYLKESKNLTANPIIEKEYIDTIRESCDETGSNDIQLEYISYPEMTKIDFLISNYPVNVAYCKVSADLGRTSTSKIHLKKENQITYYVPDNFNNFMHDIILFKFYDENLQFIKDSKITIEYDKNEKHFQIIEMKKINFKYNN